MTAAESQPRSLQDFVEATGQADSTGGRTFEKESSSMLEVRLDGLVWMKLGVMIAYRGEISFTREGVLDQGLGEFFKKKLTGEGAQLTKAEGQGRLYLADEHKKISILNLQEGESVTVNGNDVLAYEQTLSSKITTIKGLSGVTAGGLFNLEFDGPGMLAVTTHGDPVTLRATADNPVLSDPNATVLWSTSLKPEIKTDVSLKTFFGRGSGESLQMRFAGDGFVVVQPHEELPPQPKSNDGG
jgi:uncharacterized protein (AIM24 family)